MAGILVGGPDGIGTNGPSTYTVYSPWDRVEQNTGGSANPVRPPTLATPVISGGSVSAGSPQFSWTAVPGATYYRVWRQQNGTNQSGALEYIGPVLGTVFGDPDITDATSQTYSPSDPWVTYWVVALSNTEMSVQSGPIYFQRTCPPGQTCNQ